MSAARQSEDEHGQEEAEEPLHNQFPEMGKPLSRPGQWSECGDTYEASEYNGTIGREKSVDQKT